MQLWVGAMLIRRSMNKIGKLVVKAVPNPVKQMSKTILRHTSIQKYFWHFCWPPYLYTCSLYENTSFIIVSAEAEYILTRSCVVDHVLFAYVTLILFMCSNIPASPAYGVYISQLIRFARASSNYSDFLKRDLHLRNRLRYKNIFDIFVDFLIFIHVHYMKIHRLSSSLQRRNIFWQDLGIGI
jgi:hypothetical protein